MAKAKKLTLSNITKLNNELNERKLIRVCGDYEVQIHLTFRRTLISKLLLDYITILQNLRGRENITDETIMQTTSLINALTVKYFSDIPLPDIENIEKLIQVSNALLDLNIMDELFGENGFPKDQIELLSKEIEKAAKGIGTMLGELAVQSTLSDVSEDDEDATTI
jgi:uncharacterized protein YabN with tetrapyrrole methylase and pyrophosphatase domain